MAQEMYKHDALLHLLWEVAAADYTGSDLVADIEDEYYEKVKNAEGITISFSDMVAKREELGYGGERIINEALKATNGCGREWRTKVYGYMWRMAIKSGDYDEFTGSNVTTNEYALIKKAEKYFGITEDEADKAMELTRL